MFRHTPRVERWRCLARQEAPDIPEAVVLSLIHVESAGDESAKRPGSQFHGLLQMGRMAGIDVGFQDLGSKTTSILHGNGELAIRMFARYQDRYSDRTYGDPDRYALLWKGGPGYLRKVNALVDTGEDFDDAVAMVGRVLKFSAAEYLTRFRAAMEVWDAQHD